jgi:hypothetical protein
MSHETEWQRREYTDLHGICSETISDTKVEACFTFSYQLKPSLPVMIVRNEAGENCSFSHLVLLRTFPAVRMAQDKLYAIFHGSPQVRATGMSRFDVISCALIKISQKVGKSLNRGDICGKWGKVLISDMSLR